MKLSREKNGFNVRLSSKIEIEFAGINKGFDATTKTGFFYGKKNIK